MPNNAQNGKFHGVVPDDKVPEAQRSGDEADGNCSWGVRVPGFARLEAAA